MKNGRKRILAMLIVIVMILGMVPNVFANGDPLPNPVNGVPNGSLTEAPGVLINKTAKKVDGVDNTYEITLTIQAKAREVSETTDVVLVIDRSGSMAGDRLTNAQSAAVSFVEKLLPDSDPDNTTTRIALVSFGASVSTNKNFTGYGDKAALISAINGLNASGGTHIQAGIQRAISVLDVSTATHKAIVFLGDGGATYSYKPNNPNANLEFWKNQWGVKYNRTTFNIPQSNFSTTTIGNGKNEYDEYETGGSPLGIIKPWYSNNYRHGAHAVAEANSAPSDQKIYTIALDAGPEGEWTLQNMGRTAYYNSPTPASLQAIYDAIARSISKTISDINVVDPIGGHYIYEDDLTTTHPTASYDTTERKITWSIDALGKNEIATLSYKVRLDVEAEGFVDYDYYYMNGTTILNYKDVDGASAQPMPFPIPKAYGVKPVVEPDTGRVVITKEFEGTDTPPIGEIKFALENNEGYYKIAVVENGKAVFEDIPVGSYTLEEVIMPTGYTNDIEEGTTVDVVKGETTSVTVVNKLKEPTIRPGRLIVKKETVGDQTKKFLFRLKYPDNSPVEFELAHGETFDKMDIPYGTYSLKENLTDGYTNNLGGSNWIYFTLDENNPTQELTFKNQAPEPDPIHFKIDKQVTKPAERPYDNYPIGDLVFHLSKDGEHIQSASPTGGHGMADFYVTEGGLYTITEEIPESLTDYFETPSPLNFNVSENEIGEVFVFTNIGKSRPEEMLGTITVEKEIENMLTGESLEGFTFSIVKMNDNEVPIYETEQELTTDASGEVIFTDLEAGTYWVTEVDVPTGYTGLTAGHNVTLTNGEQGWNNPTTTFINRRVDTSPKYCIVKI